jgi:pectinesterase
MAEYAVSGPGFNRTGRVEGGVTTLLDKQGWRGFSEPEKVFQRPTGEFGNVEWIDWGVVGEKM